MIDFSDYFKTATDKFRIPLVEFKKLWTEIDDDITRGNKSPGDLWEVAIDRFNLKNADDYNFLDSWISDYKPIRQVHLLAEELSGKYSIGLLSNLCNGMMPKMIELGLVADINYSSMILSNKTGLKKPERGIYELAAKTALTEPGEILLIDDRRDFLDGARAAGWQTFLFDQGNVSRSVKKLQEKLL